MSPQTNLLEQEPSVLDLLEGVLTLGRDLPEDLDYRAWGKVAHGLAARLPGNALRDTRRLRMLLWHLEHDLERSTLAPEGPAITSGLATGPQPRPGPGPDPIKLCPDLTRHLRVTLELPYPAGRERDGSGLYMHWPVVTGDDLVAGILLLDYRAFRRGGLGSGQSRLRWALNEMLRRYRAAGGAGAERVGVVLARVALDGRAEPAALELTDGRESSS